MGSSCLLRSDEFATILHVALPAMSLGFYATLASPVWPAISQIPCIQSYFLIYLRIGEQHPDFIVSVFRQRIHASTAFKNSSYVIS